MRPRALLRGHARAGPGPTARAFTELQTAIPSARSKVTVSAGNITDMGPPGRPHPPDPQLAWPEMHVESNLSSNKETEILPMAEPAQ